MRKKQDNEKIYEAALKVFAKNGYKKATLDAIAEKLNMTNANLYGYASSKQALYHDSVQYAMTKWQNKVVDAIGLISDPVELLKVLSDSAVKYLSEDKVFCQILRNDPDIFPLFPTVDPYEDINKKSFLMLRETLRLGVESGNFNVMDVDKCARILFGIYKGLIIETYIQTDSTVMDNYYATRDMLFNGIVK